MRLCIFSTERRIVSSASFWKSAFPMLSRAFSATSESMPTVFLRSWITNEAKRLNESICLASMMRSSMRRLSRASFAWKAIVARKSSSSSV